MSIQVASPFGIPETREDIEAALREVNIALEKKEKSSKLQDESLALSLDFSRFAKEAWPQLEPHKAFMSNWHIDAISDHLVGISKSQLRKLQIWVPPGSMKSRLVSVLWPAWEWTHTPSMRYWTASYDISLSKEMAMYSRDLMMTDWYRERWEDEFGWRKTDESFFVNDRGGHRLSTSPQSKGTGKHGDRVMFDDPLNAQDANMISRAVLESTNEWYSSVTGTRGLPNYAEIIVMKWLNENDSAAHALGFGEADWTVLCLPERYEKNHPYAWEGDPRKEGDLLWPQRRPESEHLLLVKKLGLRHAASQLQQRPAPREGAILLRGDWRYYPPEHMYAAENGDTKKLPPFHSIVISFDTTFKDLKSSDYVAGGVWGIHGADRFLLKTFHQRASLSATKTAMLEMRVWAMKRWPKIPVRLLIEKASNGVEIVKQLQKEIPGVIPVVASVDKKTRAEAAEPDFNSHNVHIAGAAKADWSDYNPAETPEWAQEVIEQCSAFPAAKNDDLVDMVTLALNWSRTRTRSKSRTASALRTAQRNRRRRPQTLDPYRHQ